MAKYTDYYGQPTDSEAKAEEAARRNARDLAADRAAGKEVEKDYYDQPTTDPRLIERAKERNARDVGMKRGGKVSASKRADGIAQRGKTRGRMI